MRTTLKSLFLALSLAILGSYPLSADQVSATSFKGLNSNENSVIIDPSQAQDLLNVDVSAGGKSIKKRSGYGLYKAIGTGQPMRGGYHAFDSSGNDYQIWGSSTSLYGIVADGTPAQLISSATLNSTWDCADTQGNSYCVDSNRDAFIKTNGSTKQWYVSPLGSIVEATPDRIVVTGVASSPNTLYVSQSNNFTNFTTGVNDTDAFTEVIAAPGSHLTHLRWGCGKLLWWKDASFGTFDFDNQYTAQVKTVSDVIGTFDNTSAIDPGGNVWFRGQDGHTWKYDCSSLEKMTVELTPTVGLSGRRVSNLWFQTTTQEFELGVTSDTNISNNTVYLNLNSSGTVSDPGFEGADWLESGDWSHYGSFPVMSGTLTPVEGSLFEADLVTSPYDPKAMLIDATDSTVYVSTNIPFWNDAAWHSLTISSGTALGRRCNLVFQVGSQQVISPASFIVGGPISMKYSTNYGVSGGSMLAIDSITVGGISTVSTGYYTSAVHNAPNLRTWGTVSAGYDNYLSTHTLYMRSSTSSFTVNSSTPAWSLVRQGGLVSVSTGTYFQFKDVMVVTSSTTRTPELRDISINWYEGDSSDQAYMQYFDNAIWESVTYGDGQSANNYIFKYDLINDGWTLYNIGTGGMLIENNILYFGSPSTSEIYNYGTSHSDNGSPISAYWRSKSFTGSDPFLQNQLSNIDVFSKKDQGASLTITYTTDTSTATSYAVSLSTSSSVIQNRKKLPSGKLGYTFDLEVGDNSVTSNWEMLGYRIGFIQLPYRPTQ